MDDKAAFGFYPQLKPKRTTQDPEAAKNVPIDLLRGRIAGTLGMPGDIEQIARDLAMLAGAPESQSFLPTTERVLPHIPLGSDTPVSRAASGLGSLTSNPMDVVRAGKVATQAAKAAKPAIGQALEEYMFNQGLALPAYRPHTPLKPDPTVGSRYKTEHVGNLTPKTEFNIEKEQGSSVMSNPWDLTSRGEKVLEVSDVPLAKPIITEGGHDFARDIGNIESNIGGASGTQIAQRMQDRVNDAYFANVLDKGTGRVFTMPSTMDITGSHYSTMPVDIAMDLLTQAELKPKELKKITNDLQTFMFEGDKGKFKNAAAIGTPEFYKQLREGGQGFSAGDLRKGVMDRLSKTEYQKMIGFNIEDIYGAIGDEALKEYPKGFVGNTMIETMPFAELSKASHQSYESANAGKYAGSMPSMPLELMMPDLYHYFESMYLANPKYQKLTPNQLRTTIVNTIEKKGSVISQPINQRVVDNVMRYKEGLKQGHFNPKDYKSVMDYMAQTGGYKKGGLISDNPDTMMMEVEDQKFVGGGIAKAAKTAAKSAVATRELEKQAVLRAEAATKSAAKQALMPQYNEAVKGQTQKQKPLSFEQWKAINYPDGTQGLQNAPQKQTFKYPQEEAMRLAQQRAALPIEQGGLGLPPNNTTEQRAKAMGFNTEGFHGTDAVKDFKKFKVTPNDETGIKGVSFALDPKETDAYWTGRWMHEGEHGGRVIPVMVRGKAPEEYLNLFEQVIDNAKTYPKTNAGQDRMLKKTLKDLDSLGIDYSQSIGGTEFSVLEPDRIRSRFAAFDPFRKTAATAAAMGVAAPDLLAEENKASGGAVYNTDPDMSDGGRIIEGAPFKRGGNVSLDAMYMAVNDAKFRRK
jgi:hypothetical protein